jgi:hypothetical protein
VTEQETGLVTKNRAGVCVCAYNCDIAISAQGTSCVCTSFIYLLLFLSGAVFSLSH